MHTQVLAFNPKYKDAEGALICEWMRLRADIAGNREFLAFLRNQGKFSSAEENRELDLTVIDYGDLDRESAARRNKYEVTEEFYVHNGHQEAAGRGSDQGHQPRQVDRKDGGRGERRPVPRRAVRARQAGARRLRGPANQYRRST